MKTGKWLLSFLALLFIFTFSQQKVYASDLFPNSDYYVLDELNILPEELKQEIIDTNLYYETTQEKPQIVVVTTKNIDVDSEAVEIFENFKVGNSELDNGILILFAKNESTNNIRIETGYGLEGALPDSLAGNILDEKLELLKSDNVSEQVEGLSFVFNQVAQNVESEYEFNYSPTVETIVEDTNSSSGGGGFFIFFVVVFVFSTFFHSGANYSSGGSISSSRSRSSRSSSRSRSSGSRGGGGRSGGGGASR